MKGVEKEEGGEKGGGMSVGERRKGAGKVEDKGRVESWGREKEGGTRLE